MFRNAILDDAQAYLFGSLLCALALRLLADAGVITGQTAGLAVLINHLSDVPLGSIFFAVNIPIFCLAFFYLGEAFAAKSVVAVTLIAVFTELLPYVFSVASIHPAFAAVMGGLLAGVGLIIIFRHGGSVGGIGIFGLWLQDRNIISVGWTQMAFDVLLFLTASFFMPIDLVLWSALGTALSNVVIIFNHRPDRYINNPAKHRGVTAEEEPG